MLVSSRYVSKLILCRNGSVPSICAFYFCSGGKAVYLPRESDPATSTVSETSSSLMQSYESSYSFRCRSDTRFGPETEVSFLKHPPVIYGSVFWFPFSKGLNIEFTVTYLPALVSTALMLSLTRCCYASLLLTLLEVNPC